jgi:CrcB protein
VSGKFWVTCVAIGTAGFVGAITRYLVGMACHKAFGRGFPVGTMVINLSGSFLLGWFVTWASGRAGMTDLARLTVATGFVGAYTTFSTFAFESNLLIDEGHFWKASLNLVGSLILGLVAVRLGIALAK